MDKRPAFLITIDTEGDNLWGEARRIETKNARFLARFQVLCERFAFKPCWLTNYEMVLDPAYQEFARDYLRRGTAELGMHLHAWNSPPLYAVTPDDMRHKPYLVEYPTHVLRAKVDFLSKLLADTFQVPVTSHRAGRWAFNTTYARALQEHGYTVDCSVTPYVSWRATPGDPRGSGGSDYTNFPRDAYILDTSDISRAGSSTMLEVPVTIRPKHGTAMNFLRYAADMLRRRRHEMKVFWLRPRGGNLQSMIALVDRCLAEGADYVEFMLHSSELMPGGAPRFPDEASIERLYDDLERLFEHGARHCVGMTLSEYRQRWLEVRADQ